MDAPKFTSFTTCDFLNEVDLAMFHQVVEATAPYWVEEMKKRGLLRWSMNRVWNSEGEVYRLIMVYEYKDEAAYKDNRAYIDNAFKKNEAFQKLKPTAKFATSRCTVISEV